MLPALRVTPVKKSTRLSSRLYSVSLLTPGGEASTWPLLRKRKQVMPPKAAMY